MARSTPAQNPRGWARTTRMRLSSLAWGGREGLVHFAGALYAENAQRLAVAALHSKGRRAVARLQHHLNFVSALHRRPCHAPKCHKMSKSRLDHQFANPIHLCLVVPQRRGSPTKKSEDSSRGKNSRKRPIRGERRQRIARQWDADVGWRSFSGGFATTGGGRVAGVG